MVLVVERHDRAPCPRALTASPDREPYPPPTVAADVKYIAFEVTAVTVRGG